jgi:outer membrane protein TolC
MKYDSLFILLLLMGAISSSANATGSPLKLEDYLDQVKSQSPLVKSSNLQIEGTEEVSAESALPVMPRFTFQGSYTDDRREIPSAFTRGSTSSAETYTFGFDQQFKFGTAAKLTYSLSTSKTFNFNFGSINNPVFNTSQTQFDLSQPLWRNSLGAETRATTKATEAAAMASHFAEKFKLKQTLANAESTYFRLAIARESLKLQEEVLDRSQKILEWTEKRVRNQLADKADLLQSKAAFQARQLEIESARNEERSSQLAFNILRASVSDQVSESLSNIDTRTVLDMKAPAKAEVTDDVKAAEENERAVVASNEVSRQRALPELAVTGSVAYNGVNALKTEALNRSFTTNHPMYMVALRFSTSLDFGDAAAVRSGRVKQQLAAEALTLHSRLSNEQAWEDLEKRFSESKGRLKLADELVKAQKEKIDYEKYRFNLGRSTTFQVLTYEQDYAQALLARLRIEQEILTIHAQMKAYSL